MLRYITAFLIFFTTGGIGSAYAVTAEDLLQPFEGQWAGSGQVVAGKYKGTKFTCNLAGISQADNNGMTLEGNCRMGIFSQPMKAHVIRGVQGYHGTFNDGADGKGLDIVSGELSKNHMTLGIQREKLNGVMTAHLTDDMSLNITLAIKVQTYLIPLIDMKLKRNTPAANTNLAKN